MEDPQQKLARLEQRVEVLERQSADAARRRRLERRLRIGLLVLAGGLYVFYFNRMTSIL